MGGFFEEAHCQGGAGQHHAATSHEIAHFFERATDAFFSGILAEAKLVADFAQRLLFVEAQENCGTIGGGEGGDGFVKVRCELVPKGIIFVG